MYVSFRLGNWVRKQRRQYKKLTITQDRIDSLNDIDFIWNSLQDAFDRRLSELVAYKEANGDCNVPNVYKDNPE